MFYTNLEEVITSIFSAPNFDAKGEFQIYPNPAAKELHLNMVTDVAVYDAKGNKVKVVRNSDTVDISNLTSGVYWIQTIKGQVQKLIIE